MYKIILCHDFIHETQLSRLCIVFCISPLYDMNTVLFKIKCSTVQCSALHCSAVKGQWKGQNVKVVAENYTH